jgi:phage terminase Nu1 subunit (DNA packaging protein)
MLLLLLFPPMPEPSLRLNKRELGRLLGVSLPTIDAYLDRHPDFPILQQGTNGREWQFDAAAVREFLAAHEAEEAAAETRRQEQIAQLAQPLEAAAGTVQEITPGDRLKLIRALIAEDELRRTRGSLVSAPAMRQALTAAIARWNRAQTATIRQAGRDFVLPDHVVAARLVRRGDAQRQFIADLTIETRDAASAEADAPPLELPEPDADCPAITC